MSRVGAPPEAPLTAFFDSLFREEMAAPMSLPVVSFPISGADALRHLPREGHAESFAHRTSGQATTELIDPREEVVDAFPHGAEG